MTIHVCHIRRVPDAIYLGRACYGLPASPLANPPPLVRWHVA